MPIRAVGFEPVAIYRKPSYDKPGYGFRITNLDEVNPVYFETDNLTITSSASSPLPQQASVTFDGSKDVWMSSGVQGRTVLVDFSPSSLTYDNPVGVQIALNALGLATAANQVTQETAIPANIAITGTPLLHGKNNLISNTGQSLPAATTTTLPAVSVAKPGYLIRFRAGSSPSATDSMVTVTMSWADSATSQVMATETWHFACDESTAARTLVLGRGPTKGDQLTISIQNHDPSVAMTADIYLDETTQYAGRDDWRQTGYGSGTIIPGTIPGTGLNWASPACDVSGLLLGTSPAAGNSIGPSAELVRTMGMYSGEADFWLQQGASPQSLTIGFQAIEPGPSVSPNLYSLGPSAAQYVGPVRLILPRAPCFLFVANNGTSTATVFWSLTVLEYAS